MNKKGTQTTLIEDLEKEMGKNDYNDQHYINQLIKRAERGDYHDLKSELPIPKILLHRDCILLGLTEIAEKTFEGEYNELE